MYLLTSEGQYKDDMRRLLSVLDINAAQALENVYQDFAEKYGRAPGQERWELSENKVLQKKREEVVPLLKYLGFLDEKKPEQEQFDYVVVHGSSLESMRCRAAFLNGLVESGKIKNTDKTIFCFITGERELRTIEKSQIGGDLWQEKMQTKWQKGKVYNGYKNDLDSFATQTDAAKLAVEQMIVDPKLREKFVFVSTPMLPVLDDKGQKVMEENGDVKMPAILTKKSGWISANPHIPYQNAVVVRELMDAGAKGEPLEMQTYGPATGVSPRLEVTMDAVRNAFQRELEVVQRMKKA